MPSEISFNCDTPVTDQPHESESAVQELQCDNGGTASLQMYAYPEGGSTGSCSYLQASFVSCEQNGRVYDGSYSNRQNPTGVYQDAFENLTIEEAKRKLSYGGVFSDGNNANGTYLSLDDFSLSVTTEGTETANIGSATTNTTYAYQGMVESSGSFTLQGQMTDGAKFTVETLQPFASSTNIEIPGYSAEDVSNAAEEGAYFTGELRVTAEDGSTVLLKADNGVPSTASATLQNGAGESVLEVDWTALHDHPDLPLYGAARGGQ
ncbi:MAG: hypothetical protein CSB44_01265 [Gammaproteobacteria bacterium]|nr:MAG: hypothetical protein CSB44_01265 [Gammaproteobacteria bacterium]